MAAHFQADTRPPKARWIWSRRLFAVAIMYLFIEGLSLMCLKAVRKISGLHYDPLLSSFPDSQKLLLRRFLTGAIERPVDFTLDSRLGWAPGAAEVNSAGMRDRREYEPLPVPGITRIAAFGDSFTFGFQVALGETWEKQVSASDASVEVLNYGVAGYGLDQGYLRYEATGKDYHPKIVLIGYMSENLNRDVNVYRPFYVRASSPLFQAKPRYRIRDGHLELLANPLTTINDYQNLLDHGASVLRRLGQNDYFYQTGYSEGRFDFSPTIRLIKILRSQMAKRLFRPIYNSDGIYNVKSEAYEITVGIFDKFYQHVIDNGALPIILIFPSSDDIARGISGKAVCYAPLLDRFRSKGYRFIDMRIALQPYASPYRPGELFNKSLHYSPLGNRIVAQFLLEQIRRWGLLGTSSLRQATLR